ncbi:MGH1-like glycoside hydrolase domain-containing protein [Sphaerotilus mobilis]|uniref:Trehalase n=1 Tax=Sphaerotilus mobilis TaxID=47994 RepID=A0A4Q7LTH1_9BURK|nr:trehalase family glycosidase [Sphaerotilus mobilis]RZS58246.1 trehalase [Sphaerotilus mobilis]
MTPQQQDQLRSAAQATLRANDRGGYAVPSPRLYPFQWNWDAAVNAVGWQTFDEPRAWQEIETLLTGQWANGLLPSIVFHRPADSYFPGPQEWGCDHLTPPTTSISQPPLLATMVRRMRDHSRDPQVDQRLRTIVPKIVDWHRWWYRDRDPEQTGLVVTYHPWETGSDNSPAWDEPLARVPATPRSYQRRDTGVVDGSMRPHKAEYDRFVYLLDFFRDCRFDPRRIYDECPLRIVDFALNAILLRANLDLAHLCEALGLHSDAAQLRDWHQRGAAAIATLWSPTLRRHVSLDTRSGKPLPSRTHAGFLAWYAHVFTGESGPQRQLDLLAELDEFLGATRHALASTHPTDPGYDPRRYWRGAVWPHINWLVAEGLAEHGHAAQAQRLRDDTLALVQAGGLFEYFAPDTGEGLGGPDFSWTAAITLILLQTR